MRRAQDRARSARFRKNGARSATIESRALGALKLASEASCAQNTTTSAILWYVCVIFFQNFSWFQFLNNWKRTNIYSFCLSYNFLNIAWKNFKFWVSLLLVLVYQSLKFHVNRKHGFLKPSDLPWKTPYIEYDFDIELKKGEDFNI